MHFKSVFAVQFFFIANLTDVVKDEIKFVQNIKIFL